MSANPGPSLVPNAATVQRLPIHPRDVAVIGALTLCFKPRKGSEVATNIVLHVSRVIAHEVSGLSEPSSYKELYRKFAEASRRPGDRLEEFLELYQRDREYQTDPNTMSELISNVERLVNFEGESPQNVPNPKQPYYPFDRRSLFGITVRRARLNWVKLSFQGQIEFVQRYQAWLRGESPKKNPPRVEIDKLLLPTPADHVNHARTQVYDDYLAAMAEANTQKAAESLRRFFDQHLTASEESGLHQHALLNLARLHYCVGELLGARHALEEAIKVSRAANDRETLQRCMALLRRIAPSVESPQVVQKGTDPVDVLWDIKRSMDMGEPIQVGFSKLYECIGCENALPTTAIIDYWSRHAVQGALWRLAGMNSLAQIQDNMIIAFVPPGQASEPRFVAQLSRARQLARQGRPVDALAGLLSPDVWRGLNVVQKETWARKIWTLLEGRARRRQVLGQNNLIRDFFKPRRPADMPPTQVLREDHMFLRRVDSLQQLQNAIDVFHAQQIPLSLQPLLDALWTTEFRGTWGLYRTAVALLADLGIGLGMARSGREFLEECMSQILNGGDLEQRGYACFTLAKCIMTSAKGDETPIPPGGVQDHLKLALPYLIQAEADYAAIEFYTGRLDVLYTLSVVYHNLGMVPERDRAAELHAKIEAERVEAANMSVDEELKEIMDLVAEIAARG
ncbi:APC5 (anaphase-promoting complex subunit 5) domain-containing protein [Ceratobasidium sp. AG-Ba]|nr:APC5 (anaphase-promoting complex subunit 5) domain-containing protein [Ceratobasidium sp. AG-Ba]